MRHNKVNKCLKLLDEIQDNLWILHEEFDNIDYNHYLVDSRALKTATAEIAYNAEVLNYDLDCLINKAEEMRNK